MKRRVILFPRYSHGMCLVKSVFPSIGAVKSAVWERWDEHEGEEGEGEEGVEGWPALCCAIVTLAEQRDALGWPLLAGCGG
jgi:hypothetical protein